MKTLTVLLVIALYTGCIAKLGVDDGLIGATITICAVAMSAAIATRVNP